MKQKTEDKNPSPEDPFGLFAPIQLSRRHFIGGTALAAGWVSSGLFLPGSNLFANGDNPGPTDEAVEVWVKQLQALLIRNQNANGSWNLGNAEYRLGLTALVILALKHSEIPNSHAAIEKGVQYILQHKTGCVYSEGLVPCALEMVDPKKYQDRISHAFSFLLDAQSSGGGWNYRKTRGGYDNSNTQFAILGLAAAERCGFPYSKKSEQKFERVKKKAINHWKRQQHTSGGWGYHGGTANYLSMTCAGIASLHLLGEHFEKPGKACGEYLYGQVMKKGLKHLGEILDRRRRSSGIVFAPYSLYALERVGIFLDLHTINGHDWYREGAEWYRGNRDHFFGAGSSISNHAFNLLFLAKGKAPIAIAKWHWGGDWNNDHNDVRSWVKGAGTRLKMKLDWWEAKLDRTDSPAAKASMIFVNGHKEFTATDKELAFLRYFLMQRGTVVAEGCCDKQAFAASFQKVMTEKLFPNRNATFRPITPKHPICSIAHRLSPDEIGALEFKASCQKFKMILLTRDISCALNEEEHAKKDMGRARKVATNLLAWSLLSRKPKGKLNSNSIEDEALLALTGDQIALRKAEAGKRCRLGFGRLVHRGEWDVDRKFFKAMKISFAGSPGMPQFEQEIEVLPDSDDLFNVPLLFMTGHEDPALKPAEYLPLRTYLQNGGFILASSCCSSNNFDQGFRRLVRLLAPNDKLEQIPDSDPIWTTAKLAGKVPVGTKAYKKRFAQKWSPLMGIKRERRWILVYSPVDFCCALEDDLTPSIPAYTLPSSVDLIGNIVSYAFSP